MWTFPFSGTRRWTIGVMAGLGTLISTLRRRRVDPAAVGSLRVRHSLRLGAGVRRADQPDRSGGGSRAFQDGAGARIPGGQHGRRIAVQRRHRRGRVHRPGGRCDGGRPTGARGSAWSEVAELFLVEAVGGRGSGPDRRVCRIPRHVRDQRAEPGSADHAGAGDGDLHDRAVAAHERADCHGGRRAVHRQPGGQVRHEREDSGLRADLLDADRRNPQFGPFSC